MTWGPAGLDSDLAHQFRTRLLEGSILLGRGLVKWDGHASTGRHFRVHGRLWELELPCRIDPWVLQVAGGYRWDVFKRRAVWTHIYIYIYICVPEMKPVFHFKLCHARCSCGVGRSATTHHHMTASLTPTGLA